MGTLLYAKMWKIFLWYTFIRIEMSYAGSWITRIFQDNLYDQVYIDDSPWQIIKHNRRVIFNKFLVPISVGVCLFGMKYMSTTPPGEGENIRDPWWFNDSKDMTSLAMLAPFWTILKVTMYWI